MKMDHHHPSLTLTLQAKYSTVNTPNHLILHCRYSLDSVHYLSIFTDFLCLLVFYFSSFVLIFDVISTAQLMQGTSQLWQVRPSVRPFVTW